MIKVRKYVIVKRGGDFYVYIRSYNVEPEKNEKLIEFNEIKKLIPLDTKEILLFVRGDFKIKNGKVIPLKNAKFQLLLDKRELIKDEKFDITVANNRQEFTFNWMNVSYPCAKEFKSCLIVEKEEDIIEALSYWRDSFIDKIIVKETKKITNYKKEGDK